MTDEGIATIIMGQSENPILTPGKFQKSFGFLELCSKRFVADDMDPSLQECSGNRNMKVVGSDYDYSFDSIITQCFSRSHGFVVGVASFRVQPDSLCTTSGPLGVRREAASDQFKSVV
jgi:hypothetical protein